ncbi:MAG: signal peptidase [Gaiellaceae bacterium]|nr:signal peptidase [Gaiellaceae bacterium]
MNSNEQRQARRTIEKIARGALLLLVGFAAATFLLLAIGPRLGWYRPMTVLSGSMGPTFSPGDLILVRPEPMRDVRVGQVISFRVPTGAHQVETHRVIKLVRSGDHPIVQTQGDANDRRDPWTAELHGTTAWRESVVIPYAGYAIHGLRSRALRLSAVLVAPALLALLFLLDLWLPSARKEQHAAS